MAKIDCRPLLLLIAVLAVAASASGRSLTIGVSWSNFQEERWKTDERAMRAALEMLGARYVSADAQSSTEKQLSDIEGLIARGADALVILAQDADAIAPAVSMALAEGIPVIAYDRLIEMPGVFYLSFDNQEVGRIQAREILARVPSGRFAFIKGSAQDPNSDFVHSGQVEVLALAIASGDIEIVGEQYVDSWLPEVAQRTMEQILTVNDNRVDAVVCSNDGMAGGVVAALTAQGMEGIPVSGQDGDYAALNRIARGTQAVSVWKDSRELGRMAAKVAVALANGAAPEAIEGRTSWRSQGGGEVDAILLSPIAITRERLDRVIDAGWVPRKTVCRGVGSDPPVACTP